MTRNLFALFIFVSTLFIFGCGGTETDGGTTTNTTATKEETKTAPKHVEASYIAPFIGMWHYATPVSFDGSRDDDYRGRWIQFDGDGNFTSGKWTDQTNTGTFSYDPKKQYLTLDYSDDKADRDFDWKIMQGPESMIWMGNTEMNKTGDQIQMKRITERPEKTVGE